MAEPSAQPSGASGTSSPGPKSRAWWGRARRTLRAVGTWFYANVLVVVCGLWVLGQVFRDRYHLTGLCMFIPTAVVAVALAGVALVAWLCTCRRAALAAALLAIPPAVMVVAVENQWSRPATDAPAGAPTLRLVNWNMWGGQRGWDRIIDTLLEQKADIYVLSEAYSEVGVKLLLDELGPDYTAGRAHSMVVVARGNVARPSHPRISGRAYLFVCTVDGTPVSVLVADLPSLPVIHRAPFLKQVRAIVEAVRPDLIVGDFNAPRRSLYLSRLSDGYAHAYEVAGKGWSATWPAQLPLWAIDQCITGPDVRALRYDLVTSDASDHRMQLLDFAVSRQGGQE